MFSGVPQGSVIGPVLFILYINDLPKCLKNCTCKIFADDTKVSRKADTLDDVDKIQEDLESLHEWTVEWTNFLEICFI